MIVFYILLALLVLVLMIVIHELGHYLVGRWLGFRINEFSVGFGKAIWQRTNKKGEKISLRWIPLGGYCAFYGEDGEEKKEDGTITNEKNDPDVFTNKPAWKRILVFVAGAGFNFISAIIFSFILLVSFGYGNAYVVQNVCSDFVDHATEQNQISLIENGDKILEIDGQKINYVWEQTVENMVENTVGNSYTLTIQKESGEIEKIKVEVQNAYGESYNEESGTYETDTEKYTGLGMNLALTSTPLSFWEALLQCVSFTVGLAWMVLKTLWLLITGQLALSALGGTLTVISTVATTVQTSFSALFIYLPLIAANLAVFNLLPFPALDGAHIMFTTIEAIRGKPINRNVEAWIHFVGLIILLAFVIIVDLNHFLS